MDYIRMENNAILFENDGEVLRIEPWGKDSLRVRAAMMREIQDTDYALLPAEETEAVIQIKDGFTGSITNGRITACLEVCQWKKRCQISFYNQKGELLLKEAGHGGALNNHSRHFRPRLGGDYELTVTFQAREEEKLFGMGQYQQELLDIKNCVLELAHRNSQASVPFVLSDAGYGFLWHNPAVGKVVFGKNLTEWYAESTEQMDYWITAGDTPEEIEKAYAKATGTVPMMPEYGLGFWQCKLRYWNQEQLLKVAREYHKRGVPVDVIVVDFYHWPKCGDFRFDEADFPDPKAMVDELREYGMELMVSIWPQINLTSENYEEMRKNGLLIKNERGVEIAMRFEGENTFFDATNPRARDYVWKLCKKNYYDYGIKVFWLDEAEPEFSVYDYDNYRYFMGPATKVGNIYPQLYARTFYEGQRKAGMETAVNLIRCAWAGSQRYGALVWSGDIHSDWETFRKQLCAGLNMGIAGIPWWTTDIGGFSGGNPNDPAFRQLLVRWFQWGTFCPVMRLHGDRVPQTPLTHSDGSPTMPTGADNEIWSFGDENTPILEKYIRFREEMRPYTRELMKEAHEEGSPVIRTMFYEFPEDKACWELKDQYMFGPDVLVAPIVYENTWERKVYLPEGTVWTLIYDGTEYEGGTSVTVPADISRIPVFLRGHSHSEWIGRI